MFMLYLQQAPRMQSRAAVLMALQRLAVFRKPAAAFSARGTCCTRYYDCPVNGPSSAETLNPKTFFSALIHANLVIHL